MASFLTSSRSCYVLLAFRQKHVPCISNILVQFYNNCEINNYLNQSEYYHILSGKMKINVSILNLLIDDLQGKVVHHLYHTATWQIVVQFTH